MSLLPLNWDIFEESFIHSRNRLLKELIWIKRCGSCRFYWSNKTCRTIWIKRNVRILRESHSHLGVTGCSTKCYGNAEIKSRFTVFECKCFDKNAVAGSLGSVQFAILARFGAGLGQVRRELNGLTSARENYGRWMHACARIYTACLTLSCDRW